MVEKKIRMMARRVSFLVCKGYSLKQAVDAVADESKLGAGDRQAVEDAYAAIHPEIEEWFLYDTANLFLRRTR
ncbi:MAG: hypothetical protein UT22_C0001G0011 [Parcubacteria group bacterium GW2011_GWC2_39_11]|nr:MAG: hypothetical protein UT22_C0001G0011 [Parcubacteria group bacterium GW2011_GWC2_39_11]